MYLGELAVLRLGVMVTIRDHAEMDISDTDFCELLLFDGDLERIDESMIDGLRMHQPPTEFVHVQEFVTVSGRSEMVDLSSDDEAIRAKSVGIVYGTRELARSLGPVPVVIHPGGVRLSSAGCGQLSANLERSLKELGPSLLLLENMPWFYWLPESARALSNLCVSVEDVGRFSGLVEGLTLDVCHGHLSRPEGDSGYCQRFMARFGDRVRHLHVSDASVPDKEGLQIGDGEIDFSWLKGSGLPTAVEIWNGHENGGEGFKQGVERLRSMEARW